MADPTPHLATETVHLCPPGDSGLMPCCNRTPFEVPRTDRMTLDRSLVTCHALSSSPGTQVGDS